MLEITKVSVEHQTSPRTPKRQVAVVLAGCGAKDGSEITEAVTLLVALSERGIGFDIFAPDRATFHTVDHLTDKETSESRNILHEAARIARGKIIAVQNLKSSGYDALCFAGGFGVAKNLCSFARAGLEAQLENDVSSIMDTFADAKKPLAAMCIAPVLLALHARQRGLRDAQITLGDGSATDAIQIVEAWGLQHVCCASNEACVDASHGFVSSPAYMIENATPADILASARALVCGLETLWIK